MKEKLGAREAKTHRDSKRKRRWDGFKEERMILVIIN